MLDSSRRFDAGYEWDTVDGVRILRKECFVKKSIVLRRPGVRLAIRTGNRKTGSMVVLYLPIDPVCPVVCPYRKGGCYAQRGRVGIIVRRLERECAGMDPCAIAENAASLIRDAARLLVGAGIPLRLFVSGDAHCERCASVIARAAEEYMLHVNALAYGYTRNWRNVPRSTWGRVSVLASVSTDAEETWARARGYVPARLFVSSDEARARRFVVCPEQTTGGRVRCADCLLCAKDEFLRARCAGIAFVPVKGTERAIRSALERAREEERA